MRIINEGNEEILLKYIRFTCTACNCLFDADKDEYEYCGTQREGDCWKIACPHCRQTAYSKKKVGW